jgi:hypothetical protein
MPLLRALNTIPLWTLILILLAVFELYSVGLMLLARRRLGFDRLKLNNEVAGFKFSVIGVLYAVLLAFVVIAVWENYNATESAIRNEAKAAGDMAQLSYALPESQGEEMRRLLDGYVKEVQQSEWGTMAGGLPSSSRCSCPSDPSDYQHAGGADAGFGRVPASVTSVGSDRG